MCGRFALALDAAALQQAFPAFTFPVAWTPRYNLAPGQPILVLPNDGTRRADVFLWGLIPSWASDPRIGQRLINARAETLAVKPAFRAACRYRRCLVFASGFFEWRLVGKDRIPYFVRLKSGQPFAFAGLWENWHSPDGSQVLSATIVTTRPNELLAPLHDRMPVILAPEALPLWLEPTPQPPAHLQSLLRPYPAEEMEAYPVSTLVNRPENDDPRVMAPVSRLGQEITQGMPDDGIP